MNLIYLFIWLYYIVRNNMRFAAVKSVVIFLGLIMAAGVFGVIFMNHYVGHSCPVSAVSGDSCPVSANALALAAHHIAGLRNLGYFVVNNFANSVFYVLAFFVLLFWVFAGKRNIFSRQEAIFSFGARPFADGEAVSSLKKFLFWIALHYKRDPVFSGRGYSVIRI